MSPDKRDLKPEPSVSVDRFPAHNLAATTPPLTSPPETYPTRILRYRDGADAADLLAVAVLREVGFEPGPYHDTVCDRGFMTATKV